MEILYINIYREYQVFGFEFILEFTLQFFCEFFTKDFKEIDWEKDTI